MRGGEEVKCPPPSVFISSFCLLVFYVDYFSQMDLFFFLPSLEKSPFSGSFLL